jgi:hypothetical protein
MDDHHFNYITELKGAKKKKKKNHPAYVIARILHNCPSFQRRADTLYG